MKILLENAHTDGIDRAELVIHQPADAPVLTIRMPGCQPRDLVLSANEFRPWSVMRVHGSKIGGPYVNRDVAQSRDWLAAHSELAGVDPRPFATVAWGATADDLVIIAWRRCLCGLPFEATGQTGSEFDKIEVCLPGFHGHGGTALRAKADLLQQLNPMNSIAELEKQVDLLTHLVFCQVYGEPIPAWAQIFFGACFGDSDSTKAAGEEQAIADIGMHKARVRAAIADYRAARARLRAR